jgi:hypothetical protein
MANVVIHMGFINTPYTRAAMLAPMRTAKLHGAKSRRHYSKTKTAQQVANILESKYGILQTFMNMYDDDIKDLMTEKVHDFVIQSLSQKGKLASDRMAQFMKPSTSQIEKMFRGFLDRGETGITIGAALRGDRTGRKSKSPRPAFIDTGLYRASFRVWADIK